MTQSLRTQWARSLVALVSLTLSGLLEPGLLGLGQMQLQERPNFRGEWLRTSVWFRRFPDQIEHQGDVTTPPLGPLGISVTIEETETSLTIDLPMSVSRNNGPSEHVTLRQVFSFDGTEIAGGADDSCSTRRGNWLADTFVGQIQTMSACQPNTTLSPS
jgi:hypothetical protein